MTTFLCFLANLLAIAVLPTLHAFSLETFALLASGAIFLFLLFDYGQGTPRRRPRRLRPASL
jgi:hypothetical protein